MAGCLIGSLSFVGLIFLFIVIVIVAVATASEETPAIFSLLENMLVNFAVLWLALGVASLMSGFDNKVLSIGGVVAGALVVLITLAFAFLA